MSDDNKPHVVLVSTVQLVKVQVSSVFDAKSFHELRIPDVPAAMFLPVRGQVDQERQPRAGSGFREYAVEKPVSVTNGY